MAGESGSPLHTSSGLEESKPPGRPSAHSLGQGVPATGPRCLWCPPSISALCSCSPIHILSQRVPGPSPRKTLVTRTLPSGCFQGPSGGNTTRESRDETRGPPQPAPSDAGPRGTTSQPPPPQSPKVPRTFPETPKPKRPPQALSAPPLGRSLPPNLVADRWGRVTWGRRAPEAGQGAE